MWIYSKIWRVASHKTLSTWIGILCSLPWTYVWMHSRYVKQDIYHFIIIGIRLLGILTFSGYYEYYTTRSNFILITKHISNANSALYVVVIVTPDSESCKSGYHVLPPDSGYISSRQIATLLSTDQTCPWKLEAGSGQQVEVTLQNFNLGEDLLSSSTYG